MKYQHMEFLGKRIYFKFQIRKGECSICGYKGKTFLHHKYYVKTAPLFGVIEVCAKCHYAIDEDNRHIYK